MSTDAASVLGSRPSDPEVSLSDLADQKEREWRQAQALRARALEGAARDSARRLDEEKARFQQLKADFKYNLRLLAERDAELARYDAAFAELKSAVAARDAEVSELKISMDELRKARDRECLAREELQRHYQERSRDRQREMEQYKIAKDVEMETERSCLGDIKRNLQRQVREVEEELDLQRRELSAGFDEALRRRENEHRVQQDDMSATMLAHEMKVRLLSKELELVRTANEQASSQLGDADSTLQDLHKQLKQKDWELHDQAGLKDARIAELESQKEGAELSLKRALEDFNRKHAELDRYAREREAVVLKLKDGHVEAERQLQEQIRELRATAESAEGERRRTEWSHQDDIKEKDLIINKLQREIEDVRSHSDQQLANASRGTVDKDLTITRLRETQDKLQTELAQRRGDAERYKKELSLAVEREAGLERSRTQTELDWQRRCEDLERGQYSKSEELIQRLTTARDEALAAVKEKDREMAQREDYVRALTADRDQAFATLRKHNIQLRRDISQADPDDPAPPASASQRLQALQEENGMLRDVIHGMREDMERLGQSQPTTAANRSPVNTAAAGDDGSSNPPITEEYVKILEKECRDLKLRIRELQAQVEALEQARRTADKEREDVVDSSGVNVSDNAYIRSHVQSLNDTIGALRSEKVSLSAQVKRQQARIAHLEGSVNQLQSQPYEKQTEIEQLQYELATSARRHAVEAASHRQRAADLEVQLAETRREADEYYKGGLQTNLEATSLGNQVSSLKMDLATKHPPAGSFMQPPLVHQLQDEIHSLKKRLAAKGGSEGDPMLKAKLKCAAQHISRLATERQQLIQLGNRLRSELARQTGPVRGPKGQGTSRDGAATAGGLAREIDGKLGNLEKLQYALTMQEMQFAKRGLQRDRETAEVIQVQLESSSSSSSSEALPAETEEDMHAGQQSLEESGQQRNGPPVAAPEQAQDSPGGSSSQDSVPLMMSSYGGESLQDVWRILDDGRSPTFMRSPTPQALTYYGTDKFEPVSNIPARPPRRTDDDPLGVSGKEAPLQARPRPDRGQPARAAGRPQPKRTPPKAQKLRNYNAKDEGKTRR